MPVNTPERRKGCTAPSREHMVSLSIAVKLPPKKANSAGTPGGSVSAARRATARTSCGPGALWQPVIALWSQKLQRCGQPMCGTKTAAFAWRISSP